MDPTDRVVVCGDKGGGAIVVSCIECRLDCAIGHGALAAVPRATSLPILGTRCPRATGLLGTAGLLLFRCALLAFFLRCYFSRWLVLVIYLYLPLLLRLLLFLLFLSWLFHVAAAGVGTAATPDVCWLLIRVI